MWLKIEQELQRKHERRCGDESSRQRAFTQDCAAYMRSWFFQHGLNVKRLTPRLAKERRLGRAWSSLPRGWLPKFNLVALRIHDPTELSVLGVICLLQDVAAFVPKRLE
jgi:hypothetical protein